MYKVKKASGGNAVVEHSSHHSKVEGYSQAATIGTGREKISKKMSIRSKTIGTKKRKK